MLNLSPFERTRSVGLGLTFGGGFAVLITSFALRRVEPFMLSIELTGVLLMWGPYLLVLYGWLPRKIINDQTINVRWFRHQYEPQQLTSKLPPRMGKEWICARYSVKEEIRHEVDWDDQLTQANAQMQSPLVPPGVRIGRNRAVKTGKWRTQIEEVFYQGPSYFQAIRTMRVARRVFK